ncbi:cationic peroxidase 1-like [Durio zibethinus]|uniref:Peroxidase n=1 Tax=Durio zibethinus TaxID=66656 RepID=A0A6P5XSW3_DURZI|nr:cationic peroxidase 1-like [Durio zibethinus]
MAGFNFLLVCKLAAIVATFVPIHAQAQLSPNFYDQLCPAALPTIRDVTSQAVLQQPRIAPALLRLHFHDCFVQGCDGSILLDDTPGFTGEKTALPNLNSVRGFDVVDRIKTAVNAACGGNVVSCADILAVAARDSVNLLGGPNYTVLLGRRDARNASRDEANSRLPPPFFNFTQLLANFESQGLDGKDLIVLSGAHTMGYARCTTFRGRIYNDSNIDPNFADLRKQTCPMSGGDNNTAPLDVATPIRFDTQYFRGLLQFKGLLHSDQELFTGNGAAGDALVRYYSSNTEAFFADFGASMIKMGNLRPLTGANGEIRQNCRRVN